VFGGAVGPITPQLLPLVHWRDADDPHDKPVVENGFDPAFRAGLFGNIHVSDRAHVRDLPTNSALGREIAVVAGLSDSAIAETTVTDSAT
jgi:hypothetical protein